MLDGAIEHYERVVKLPIPDKLPLPLQVHRKAGEPCPRCGATIEAVHYEDYVMCYCPARADGRQGAQGPAAVAAAEVSAIEANPMGWLDILARQPGAEVGDRWVVTDVPFALCNSCFFPRWGDDADARIDAFVAAGRARAVPQLWWLGESSTPSDLPERLRARGLDVVVEEMPGMELPLSALPDVSGSPAVRTSDVASLAEPFCSAFGVTDDAWSSVAPAFAASGAELRH